MKTFYIQPQVQTSISPKENAAEALRAVADQHEAKAKQFRRLAGFALETPGVVADCDGGAIFIEGPQDRLESLTAEGVLVSISPEELADEETDEAEEFLSSALKFCEDGVDFVGKYANGELDKDIAKFSDALAMLRSAFEASDIDTMERNLDEAQRMFAELDGLGRMPIDESDLIDEDPPEVPADHE